MAVRTPEWYETQVELAHKSITASIPEYHALIESGELVGVDIVDCMAAQSLVLLMMMKDGRDLSDRGRSELLTDAIAGVKAIAKVEAMRHAPSEIKSKRDEEWYIAEIKNSMSLISEIVRFGHRDGWPKGKVFKKATISFAAIASAELLRMLEGISDLDDDEEMALMRIVAIREELEKEPA